MILREPEVVRASFIHKRKSARRSRLRRVRRNRVQPRSQLSFERSSHPIAFPELSNIPPLTRSCRNGNDETSLESASYAGPAIASCDRMRIHDEPDGGDLDCAEKDEMSSHRPEVAVPLTSRRKFIRAAIATGGAGMLSAELGVLSARGNADTAAQIVLPAATKGVTPFQVDVPQAALDDLKRRLASTRWPERETVGDWSEGVPLQKAQALVAYWRDKYDWRRFEARINAFPQYRTQIDGIGIHFIHVRSPQQNALPIILTHGWPGSVVEFMEVIGPLSDPACYGGG